MPRVCDMPLQWRIGVLVVAGLLVIFGLFAMLGLAVLRDSLQRTVAERLAVAELTVSFLDSELEEHFEQLERAAVLAAQAPDDLGEHQHILRDLLGHAEPFVTSVFMVDQAGRLRWAEPSASVEVNADLVSQLSVSQPFSTGVRYASGVRAVGPGQLPRVVLAVPVRDPGGAPTAVIAGVIDPSYPMLRDLMATARRLGHTGHAELVDQEGRVIASSEPGRALGPAEHPSFYAPLLARRTAGAGTTGPIGDEDPAERGQRHIMAFVPLASMPWGLSLGGSEAEFSAEADRWRWQIVLFGGLSLIVAIFLVWATTSSVARPVQALTTASRRIARGDLATPVPSLGEGEVRGLAEAFDDMRRHLQQALAALAVEKSRYQGIVESMADAVFTTDAQLNISALNPAAEMLTGWRSEDVLGRPCCEVIRPLDERGQVVCVAVCPLAPAPSTNPCPAVTKETIRTRHGRDLPVATARSAIRDLSGTVVGVVHVVRDMSAEEELNRLKDEFLSMVSHELRTPLGFIKGYATTLLLPDGQPDEETTRRCLRVIVEASDELKDLVDHLVDMSKIGAGMFSVQPEPVRLSPLARAAIERARVHAHGHRLRVAMPASLPLVFADAHRIEQVFDNLLDNALKYSPAGGRVVVAAEPVASEVIVSVSDEGFGIPIDELGGLFERFHRGKRARASQIGGTGLGLAICRGIVEAHQGRIWAESPAPGRAPGSSPGTAVCFSLPIVAGPARSGARAARSPRQIPATLPQPTAAKLGGL